MYYLIYLQLSMISIQRTAYVDPNLFTGTTLIENCNLFYYSAPVPPGTVRRSYTDTNPASFLSASVLATSFIAAVSQVSQRII